MLTTHGKHNSSQQLDPEHKTYCSNTQEWLDTSVYPTSHAKTPFLFFSLLTQSSPVVNILKSCTILKGWERKMNVSPFSELQQEIPSQNRLKTVKWLAQPINISSHPKQETDFDCMWPCNNCNKSTKFS